MRHAEILLENNYAQVFSQSLIFQKFAWYPPKYQWQPKAPLDLNQQNIKFIYFILK
jgi:hypothetical protein